MKKEVTQYFCDICGAHICDRGAGDATPASLAEMRLYVGGKVAIDKEHVCPACYRVIEECVSLLAQGAKREG